MKLKLIAATALALAVSTLSAQAVPITGELSLGGTNSTDLAADTITFTSADPLNALGETGSFTALGSGGPVTFRNIGSPINFNTGLTSGSNLSCGGGCIFSATGNGLTATLDLTSAMAQVTGGFLDISGSGVLNLTGFSATPGTFSLSTQGGTGTNLTFSSTATAVPGPMVGTGLPGLIASLGALVALMRRRRHA